MRNFMQIVESYLGSRQEIDEAPISDIAHVGDWSKNSSFRHEQDRKLLTNPKAVQKIKTLWKYPEDVQTNIILVNHPDGRKWLEEGEVTRDWVEANMPRVANDILPLLKNDQVNIIFTNNTGDERVPLTGWVMAHRFGHVLFRLQNSYYFNEAVKELESTLVTASEFFGAAVNPRRDRGMRGPAIRSFLQAICTFKSARDRNLRDGGEAIFEMFAQYITTGEVKMNPPPKQFRFGKGFHTSFRGDQDDYEQFCRAIQNDLPYQLGSYFETAVYNAVGKIYVM